MKIPLIPDWRLLLALTVVCCLSGAAAGAGDVQFQYTFGVTISTGNADDVAPDSLVFGVHDDATAGYDDTLDDDYVAPFVPTPPGGGTPPPLAEAYFLVAVPGFGERDLEKDMRSSADTNTWRLKVDDLDEFPGQTITLTRTALTVTTNYLDNRTLVLQDESGTVLHSDLTQTDAAVAIGADGLYYIVCNRVGQNAAPTAVDDNVSLLKNGGTTTLAVKNNDFDADGDTMSITSLRMDDQDSFDPPKTTITTGAGGIARMTGEAIEYTPITGFTGDDSFQYQLSDGQDASVGNVTVSVQDVLAIRTHASQVVLGSTLSVQLNLQFNADSLQTLRILEVLPFTTSEAPPNAWRYRSGSLSRPSGWTLSEPAQDENLLTIDLGTVPTGADSVTLDYDVFVPAPGTEPKSFTGTAYYTAAGSRGDEKYVVIPETGIQPGYATAPYVETSAVEKFNLMALPFTNTGLAKASDLVTVVINSTGVWSWDAVDQEWDSHAKGSIFDDFDVTAGHGFFYYLSAPCRVVFNGDGGASGQWANASFDLKNGFNMIVLSQTKYDGLSTKMASAMAADIIAKSGANCTGVWDWREATQTWFSFAVGSIFDDFAVEANSVYFIWMEGAGTW